MKHITEPTQPYQIVSNSPLLQLRNYGVGVITKNERYKIVKNIDLTLHRGEIIAIVGESGGGKSILCRSLLGLDSQGGSLFFRAGQALFNQLDLVKASTEKLSQLRGRHIGMIHQNPGACLDPVMSIGRQLKTTLKETRGLTGLKAHHEALALLKEVHLSDPELRLTQYPHELSGGMNQRVMIALALAGQPELLIADEVTTALDAIISGEILALLRRLVDERGLALLLITHDLQQVKNICDRVAVMHQGQLVEIGTAANVLTTPKHHATKLLVQASMPKASVKSQLVDAVKPAIVAQANGLSKIYKTGRGLFKKSHHFTAVEDVSFQIRRGQAFGIVGESGSGKTTIARMVAGFTRPSGGQLTVDNTEVSQKVNRRDHSRRVQMIFQNPLRALDPCMKVCTQVAEPLRAHGIGTASERHEQALAALAEFDIGADLANALPQTLSGGQLQRVVMARALILKPPLLVCDEPTASLDASKQSEVLELFNRLRDEHNVGLLFISHDLAAVAAVVDELAVMYKGRIVERGATLDVLNNPQHPYTRALTNHNSQPNFSMLEEA